MIGKQAASAWLHEIPGTGRGDVRVASGEREMRLDPPACDCGADVAVLRCREVLAAPRVLPLVEPAAEQGARFEAEGIRPSKGQRVYHLTGISRRSAARCRAPRSRSSSRRGRTVTWTGLSGSAVRIGDQERARSPS